MNAITLFRACACRVRESYPDETCPVPPPAPLVGYGFFPVASGSFHNADIHADIGHRKLMFIGQDWGTLADFKRLKGGSNQNADIAEGTGHALDELLKCVPVPLNECFFTNALFGLRTTDSNTGLSPGWKSEHFITRCTDALRFQIENIQPKAIVCLGLAAPELLRRIVPACEKAWIAPETFQAIGEAKGALISGAAMGSVTIDLALLVHPSYRKRNARFRCFGDAKGHDAEVELLRALWAGCVNQAKPPNSASVAACPRRLSVPGS